jgi:hypothetical protein
LRHRHCAHKASRAVGGDFGDGKFRFIDQDVIDDDPKIGRDVQQPILRKKMVDALGGEILVA